MPSIVTLLTDFGTADGYVAEMKGVLLSNVSDMNLVDIAHDLPPHDVEVARLAVARYWRRFPKGTIHIAVVDPGVGGARAALAVESDGRFLVGPDNGVLSPALLVAGARVVALSVAPGAAPTFHGRDVFAPAAAKLAEGATLDVLGQPHEHPVIRRTPEARRLQDGAIAGEVIAIDRFGNLVLNTMSPAGGIIEIAGQSLPIHRTYADVPSGALLALIGSSGLIEVAVRDGSAAQRLGLGRGAAFVFRQSGR
jgi:S-adenosylmethionine hydrolase